MVLGVIKGFTGIFVGAVLGGEAIKAVGGIGSIPSGIRGATQTFIGLGVVGHAASTVKNSFLK